MGREDDRRNELLEAARALALHLGIVEEDEQSQTLVDTEEYSEDAARDTVEQLMAREDELVDAFEGDVDQVIEYLELVIEGAQEAAGDFQA